MGRSKSSQRWLQEHFQDTYVKRAQAQGWRSRAVFKLIEIQEKDRIIKPNAHIVDLGAAPGGWSQYARTIVEANRKVVALDILPIDPLEGVEFIQGDFRETAVLDELYAVLDGDPVGTVLSDMAPNMSGNKGIDQPSAMYLCELALDMARHILMRNGAFLVKAFQGEGYEHFLKDVRQSFALVTVRKPKASRSRSNEVYILAKGFK